MAGADWIPFPPPFKPYSKRRHRINDAPFNECSCSRKQDNKVTLILQLPNGILQWECRKPHEMRTLGTKTLDGTPLVTFSFATIKRTLKHQVVPWKWYTFVSHIVLFPKGKMSMQHSVKAKHISPKAVSLSMKSANAGTGIGVTLTTRPQAQWVLKT